ncbi:MAG: Aliphatic sulfonates import ATP-binding protein SsuB [Chroococcidiopsis cubana SAG 39.79]|uniref:Nitrate ABC transporter ATP-binding protein n=1 Tax=Chroococcidiopsis cubana SAG 39.79 TaxID=388085 RepID=A0AB37UE66_9CYAN|nr:ABC transporter ATP-binding protein [Chroococcidiopsis cubana]MDZ4872230.1 Aliphatic sulfonates import ATP-binding protein SsuB [Chroococcidiopsis cubana SAG 39.79]PSB64604.1 nitrate ABC transporter ATP-binding protein [Chroococcidiopsis cubana CCALA 043]RUT08001.1 nitrate ABC transporter ATP-binding protein [Chroococcidiopsis cubana SAG 39.79]
MIAREQVILSGHNLSKSFSKGQKQGTAVLANINFDIYAGDFVTILGQSGGGKSTLLKILGGFLSPTSGTISFHGQPLKGIDPKIGMVFQENNLYPWLNVEQNIAFGFKIRGEKLRSYIQKVNAAIAQVSLSHARKLYPHQLSGGMKQRVAIARSIAVQPDVLLLDEPFSALDIQLRRRLQDFLLSIWEQTSTTMVLVTHNIEEAILLGQKLIVIGGQPGKILESIDISASCFRHRYHPEFIQLEQYLEAAIEKDITFREAQRTARELKILKASNN